MPNNKAPSVLVIEDDVALAMALKDKLTDEGFEVMQAGDGVEGLATALLHHPDILLVDIMMPRMDGLKMLKELRGDDWGKKVKVILLTNLSEDKAIKDALDSEVEQYLVKADWSLEEIAKKLQSELHIK